MYLSIDYFSQMLLITKSSLCLRHDNFAFVYYKHRYPSLDSWLLMAHQVCLRHGETPISQSGGTSPTFFGMALASVSRSSVMSCGGTNGRASSIISQSRTGIQPTNWADRSSWTNWRHRETRDVNGRGDPTAELTAAGSLRSMTSFTCACSRNCDFYGAV